MKPFPSCLVIVVVLLGALVEAQCAWAAQCHESMRNFAPDKPTSVGQAGIHLVERSLCCGLVDSDLRRVERRQQATGHTELSASFYQSINLPFPDRPPIHVFT